MSDQTADEHRVYPKPKGKTGPKPGEHPNQYPPEKRQEIAQTFLKCLENCVSVSQAAKIAGVSTSTINTWRQEDEDFAAAWDAAREQGTDFLEDEAVDRAVNGVTEDVYYQGQVVGTRQKKSDQMLGLLLKQRRPSLFGPVGAGKKLAGDSLHGADPRPTADRLANSRQSSDDELDKRRAEVIKLASADKERDQEAS